MTCFEDHGFVLSFRILWEIPDNDAHLSRFDGKGALCAPCLLDLLRCTIQTRLYLCLSDPSHKNSITAQPQT